MQLYYDSYTFYLALLYVALTLVSGFQIGRIFVNRHNRFHYQFGFLAYNFVWGIMRSTFWLFLPWTPLAEITLEGLAVIIQVATYSFLVLYYAEVAHKIERDWINYKKKAYLAYILFNVTFLICFGVMLTMAILYGGRHPYVESGLYFFVASIYFLLVAFLARYGWKMYKSVANAKTQSVGYFQRRGLTQVVTVTIIIIIAFFSRAIKDTIGAFKIGILDVENPHDEVWRQVVMFCLFFIWEIAPTALVNLLFWHIPKQKISASKSRAAIFSESPHQSIRNFPEEQRNVKPPKRPAENFNERSDLLENSGKTKYGSAGFTKYSPYNTSPVVQDYLPSSHPNQPFRISILGNNNIRSDKSINTDTSDVSD